GPIAAPTGPTAAPTGPTAAPILAVGGRTNPSRGATVTHSRIPAPHLLRMSKLAELHHQLRSALSAATLSLETVLLIEAEIQQSTSRRSIERAMASLDEALRIAEKIR